MLNPPGTFVVAWPEGEFHTSDLMLAIDVWRNLEDYGLGPAVLHCLNTLDRRAAE